MFQIGDKVEVIKNVSSLKGIVVTVKQSDSNRSVVRHGINAFVIDNIYLKKVEDAEVVE